MKHKGDLIFQAWVDYSNITEIGGSLFCRGATLSAGSFPKLTSVGGSLDCRGATLPAGFLPKLTSVGGPLYCWDATKFNKNLKTNDPDAAELCRQMLFASFLSSGYVFADSILAKLVSKKSSRGITVYTVQICGKTEISIVIEKNGQYSHGATIKEAKESLIFKITDRDTSRFEEWRKKPNQKRPAEEWVPAYRAITGACEFGTKHFCEGKDLNREYTLKEIIKMTVGAYGHQTFKDFFGVIV